MYKVIVKYKDTKDIYDFNYSTYSKAYDFAKRIKELGGKQVVVSIETDIKKTKYNDFIMRRFTRRD